VADADLKPRPAYAERCVTIQQSQRYRQWAPSTAGQRKAPPLSTSPAFAGLAIINRKL
jgi:hypothetical protein